VTTIIGYQGADFAILGADSQITDGDKRIISPSTPKIVKINKYLLAVSGDCRPGDILMYLWKPPAYDGTDPVKFVGRKIIPSIIAVFKAQGYDYTKDAASYSYLLAFNGNIFEIGDELSISQSSDGIYGVGSGSPYGMGYMASIKGEVGKDEILQALDVSAKYDINTVAPFQIEVQKKI
jgi:ATP-dependent protease HslVU (ClpYQ) peptidase subunit